MLARFGRAASASASLALRAPRAAQAWRAPAMPRALASAAPAADAETQAQAQAQAQKQPGKVKTGVVMLNMGGPSTPEETGPFLLRLFRDVDIIELGGGTLQHYFGSFVAHRRTPKVQAQYEKIGGSPIRKWTKLQGEEMCKLLDAERPESAPHKAYTAFRYADPLTDTALAEMAADGVEHAVAFSQFPQWSCTTGGSSMNELWREVRRMGLQDAFRWSAIDRWPLQPGFVQAVNERIEERMLDFDEKTRKNVVIVFSAHSVPMKVVAKGDHYTAEVAASVKAVMSSFESTVREGKIPGLSTTNKHVLAWQSKVGFLPWMVPSTADVLESLGKRGHKAVLVVPVAFTSDHIETLFEIGIEYAEDAEKAGISDFRYTEGLNGSPTFIRAMADIVSSHLDAKENYSPQYKMKCLKCTKPMCRQLMNPAW